MGKTTYTVQDEVAAKLHSLALLMHAGDLSIGPAFGQVSASDVPVSSATPSFVPNNE